MHFPFDRNPARRTVTSPTVLVVGRDLLQRHFPPRSVLQQVILAVLARGSLSAWAEATWLFAYDVTNAGVEIDGLGKLNRANVGAPNQRLRLAGGLSWTREAIQLNAMVRHVGAYEDDGGGSDAFSTLDANATWSVGTWQGSETSFTVGAANLLDADPPHVNIAGSYDPRSADPRGRRVFVRVQATR